MEGTDARLKNYNLNFRRVGATEPHFLKQTRGLIQLDTPPNQGGGVLQGDPLERRGYVSD